VAFVDRVREHLQQVAQAPEGLHVPALVTVDEATQSLELDRLAASAVAVSEDMAWADVRHYVEQLRAARVGSGRARLTAIGRVFLDLQGRDAIRWLLHVEAEQASGPLDPFRMCRETAAHLAKHERASWTVGPDADYEDDVISGLHPLAPLPTIQRLGALGLLAYACVGPNETPFEYALFRVGREILEEIGGDADTPMRLLSHALVQDETQRALTAVQPALAAAARASAADSIARQARLVAHELHNALVPVQVALDGLYQLVPPAAAQAEVDRYRRRIDAGLARAFRFVDQSLAPAALFSGADEPFDVGARLRDAIAEVNGEAQGAVRLLPLGLALVKEVVETELHGTVSCEESPLGGARFSIRLPIARRGQP
jgi:hypothetical protein